MEGSQGGPREGARSEHQFPKLSAPASVVLLLADSEDELCAERLIELDKVFKQTKKKLTLEQKHILLW